MAWCKTVMDELAKINFFLNFAKDGEQCRELFVTLFHGE